MVVGMEALKTSESVKVETIGRSCRYCGNPAEPGRALCVKHAEINRQKTRDWRARMRAAGLCYRCGEPALPGGFLCAAHREEHTARERGPDTPLIECLVCGKINGMRYCRGHREGVLKLERDARTVLYSVARRCPECGIWGHDASHCVLVEQRRIEEGRRLVAEAARKASEQAELARKQQQALVAEGIRSLALNPRAHKCRVCDELTMTEYCWRHIPAVTKRRKRAVKATGKAARPVLVGLATDLPVNAGPRIEDEPGFGWVPRELPLVDPGWALWIETLNREVG